MKIFTLLFLAGAELHDSTSPPIVPQLPQQKPKMKLLRDKGEKFTPLMVAAYAGETSLAQQILERGVHPDATSDESGVTPLMLAAFTGQASVARLLLAAGAGVNVRDAEGRTALMVAAYKGDVGIARLLLAAGALVAAESHDGVTAGMVAHHGSHTDMLELLHAAGTQRLVEAMDGVASGVPSSAKHLVDALHAAKTVGVETKLIGRAEKHLVAAVRAGQGEWLLEELMTATSDAIDAGEVGEIHRLNEAIETTVEALKTNRPRDTAPERAEKALLGTGRSVLALVLATAAWWPSAAWWSGFACAVPAVGVAYKLLA